MSDERFDKHIKQKLEAVRPAFEESAWKKFRVAAPVPWYTTFFQDWGGWIFGGIASVAFLTTLYFNYLHQKANDLLHEEISTIKSNQNPENKIDTVVIEKYLTDTVYIVKTIRQVVEVPVREEATTMRLSIASSERNEPFDISARSEQNQISGRNITGIGSPSSSQNQAAKPPTTNPINEEESIKKPSIVKESEGNTIKTLEKLTDENGNVIREKPILEKEKLAVTNQPPITDLVIPETKVKEVQKKKFKIPYVHTRVGLAANYLGLKVPSIGPTAEFFFGYSNLSLGTGLLFSSPQETMHPLPKDFNQATGKRFEEIYKDKFKSQQSQSKIEDITIRTSLIKIPIAFNYYINTRSNFDFMFSAGTRLDVSVFQDIQFESNLLTDRIKEKFEARPKPKVFSGLFYGMGLQYQKGRFVGQFTPYFDFRFRQNEYMTLPRTFGINASVKYDLGRGL